MPYPINQLAQPWVAIESGQPRTTVFPRDYLSSKTVLAKLWQSPTWKHELRGDKRVKTQQQKFPELNLLDSLIKQKATSLKKELI